MIAKYIKGALVALLLFLGLGFKHFKDKSSRLDKELELEKQKNTKHNSQVKTYLEQQTKTQESIKNAETDSHINRDYFSK